MGEDGTLIVRPDATHDAVRVVLFLHGFASSPGQYRHTLEHLAADGFVVVAPTLPDFFFGHVGYPAALVGAARDAYEFAVQEARMLGAPPPAVVGYSLGGGAALVLSSEQAASAVLWAPVPITFTTPVPAGPLLVVEASDDCVADEHPRLLLEKLGGRAEAVRIAGNHLGFTDFTGGEVYDCPSPTTRDAQRLDAVAATVDFLRRQRSGEGAKLVGAQAPARAQRHARSGAPARPHP